MQSNCTLALIEPHARRQAVCLTAPRNVHSAVWGLFFVVHHEEGWKEAGFSLSTFKAKLQPSEIFMFWSRKHVYITLHTHMYVCINVCMSHAQLAAILPHHVSKEVCLTFVTQRRKISNPSNGSIANIVDTHTAPPSTGSSTPPHHPIPPN